MKRIAAALTLFTRIPIWKWCEIPSSAYSTTVVYLPLVGWITGGITGAAIYLLSFIMPMLPAVIAALVVRLLLTGAFHEDGLADFCDGFGGGRDRESILRIMKDSHIGTYGVIGLICYFLLMTALLSSLSSQTASLSIFAVDPFSKCCSSQLTNILKYARPEGAKNKISYARMNGWQLLANIIFGCLPLVPLAIMDSPVFLFSVVLPLCSLGIMTRMMKCRIGGYTGDCCGATYLVCELSMCLGIVIIHGL